MEINSNLTLTPFLNFNNENFPIDVLQKIWSFLSPFDRLICLPLVCKKWLELKRITNQNMEITVIVNEILGYRKDHRNYKNQYADEKYRICLRMIKTFSFIKALTSQSIKLTQSTELEKKIHMISQLSLDTEKLIFSFPIYSALKATQRGGVNPYWERNSYSISFEKKQMFNNETESRFQLALTVNAVNNLPDSGIGGTRTEILKAEVMNDLLNLELINLVESISEGNLAYISQALDTKRLSSKVLVYMCNEFGRIDDGVTNLIGVSILTDKFYTLEINLTQVEINGQNRSFLKWDTEDYNSMQIVKNKFDLKNCDFSQALRWNALSETMAKLAIKLGCIDVHNPYLLDRSLMDGKLD